MHIRQTIFTSIVSLLIAMPAAAATKEEIRVTAASDVLEQLLQIPERSIPPALLNSAFGIAVVPQVIKVGFGVGVRRGKGILVVRREDGSWSNPSFISLTGGSFGFQIGAQSTDVVLVFKTRNSIDSIANGQLTLGVDTSIAAGPVGRQTGAHTDLGFKAEVYSYSRNRGLFAGIALEGAGVAMDRLANAAYYNAADMTPEKIFASSGNMAPPEANRFVQTLTAQTNRLPAQTGVSVGVATAYNSTQKKSTVKTFGMPDPDEAGSEDQGLPQK
jgi:lipid-binding SYLF domain-containing protein